MMNAALAHLNDPEMLKPELCHVIFSLKGCMYMYTFDTPSTTRQHGMYI